MLLFNPAPIYILDEVDAALDLSHTQNIGQMLKAHFTHSQVHDLFKSVGIFFFLENCVNFIAFLLQFIVVSLKEGMFNNANVIFRTKFVDGMSQVTRTTSNHR